ncbi:MAG: hypothetical protein E6K11_02490 [Methanobacteriota archaeon]|nr:MAG: hypothetical protein E6K11_02490 [Euryarchaeota archaeon]
MVWAKLHHQGWKTEESRISRIAAAFGDVKLGAITPADVERFLDQLLEKRSRSTRSRYRALLSSMFSRAIRHELLSANPVKGVAKFREPEGRISFAMPEQEAAILAALRLDLRPLFTVSVHTGLRWSEQLTLEWQDVDFLTGLIAVKRSKSGYSRQVPMNSVVRPVMMDLAGQRRRPDDPREPVFRCSYTQADKFFPQTVDLVEEGTAGSWFGCHPLGWVQVALQPAHVRLEAGDGRSGSQNGSGARWLAHPGDGPALRSSGAGSPPGCRRAASPDPNRGRWGGGYSVAVLTPGSRGFHPSDCCET